MNHKFTMCETCGSAGHKGKACPLYRLNEKQEVLSLAKRVLGESK